MARVDTRTPARRLLWVSREAREAGAGTGWWQQRRGLAKV